MTKSNPFDHTPNLPGVGPNTVDPATNEVGPPPMPPSNDPNSDAVSPSAPTEGTENWGGSKEERDNAA